MDTPSATPLSGTSSGPGFGRRLAAAACPTLLAALLAVLPMLLALGGCSSVTPTAKRYYDETAAFLFDVRPTTSEAYEEDETPITEINYEAADELASHLYSRLTPDSPVFVERFTNMADPEDPSPLGRVVAEQVAAGLVQNGYTILAGEAYLPETDPEETSLTKGLQPMPKKPSILTGNYLVGTNLIYVSANVTSLVDDTLLSTHQWALPINENTRVLLPRDAVPDQGLVPSVQTSF